MSAEGIAASTDSDRGALVGKVVIWVIAGVVFAYMLWQAISNFVGVTDSVREFNDFVTKNNATSLKSSVPWVALVIDVLIAPVAFVVAWFVSRRFDVVRTAVTFLAALCAAGAVWFDVLEYVSATLRIGS
jgi:ABC-type spermidine/putrescine transport system permease subunit I